MRRKVKVITLLLSAALLSACQLEPLSVNVTGISLSSSSVSLEVGETFQLTATVSPNNASNRVVIWSTSNSDVVTVDSNGFIIAAGTGSAVITAKTDDGGFFANCSVKVEEGLSISLDKTEVALKVGETVKLNLTIKPESAKSKTIEWSSSDTGVATVENGLVKAVGSGEAKITVSIGNASASCQVSSRIEKMLIKKVILNGYTDGILEYSETINFSYDEQDRLRYLEMVCPNPDGGNKLTHRAIVDYPNKGNASLIDVFAEEYRGEIMLRRRVLDLSLNENGAIEKGTNLFYSPYGVSYLYNSKGRMTYKEESFMNSRCEDITCTLQCSYVDDCLDKMILDVEGGAYQLSFNYENTESVEDISALLAYYVTREASTPDFCAGDLALNIINRFPSNKKLISSIVSEAATMTVSNKIGSDGHVESIMTGGDGYYSGGSYHEITEETIFSYAEPGSQTYTYSDPFTYSGMGGTTWEYTEEEDDYSRTWYIVFLDAKKFYFVEDDGCGFQEMIAGTYTKNGSNITMDLSDEESSLITTGVLSGNTISTSGGYIGESPFTKTSNFKF